MNRALPSEGSPAPSIVQMGAVAVNITIIHTADNASDKATEEEKQTKVYYKHWFNKYLKINLKYGNPKYVYVGNYSNCQIKKIIKLASGK